ncbi:hypothetical protein L1987_84028 [Smallanthus sonchifolius]|uniref:Uncharacterized protein n=1 Tax=Smallanthus sonchifolius TaxID=185202 RepID=A0ACB8YCY5_9ASTR|nr:hypothetical protein L1987_84028 [Smallanthus sonchifolius]
MSSSYSNIFCLSSGLSDSSGFDDFLSDTSESSDIEFLSKVAAAASELEDTAKSKKKFVHRDRDVVNTVMLFYFVMIPSIAGTGKEPIQAQSQSVISTARKEPIQSQSNSSVQSTGRLKRDKASTNVTLSVDEKGR